MFDALEELSDLSLVLQKADITLATANKLVSKQIEICSARKETGSEYLSEANRAVAAGSFKGVAISSNSGRHPLINMVQFYQCLVDSMTVKHTSSLMFVSLSGPPVMLFEPLKYVKSWLVLNRRSHSQ